jgi:hypothetical protein
MHGPLVADTAQTIERQIEALTDTHAGVAEEPQGIADPIVTPQQLLLHQLVLLGRQRPWQTPVGAWDVVGTDQASEKRYSLGPRQFFKDTRRMT